jgi:FdhD protein
VVDGGGPRKRSEKMLVTRYRREVGGSAGASRTERVGRRPDELAVEEPLSIELDGVRVATTMRTPGHDFELAVGFCHTEGLLAGAPVNGVRYCANGSALASAYNVVTVDSGGRAPEPTPRLTITSSSCGLCGTDEIDTVAARYAPVDPGLADAFPFDLLADIPERVLADQRLFGSTGAVHAAAAFDPHGVVHVAREDVGRHNAVDKVVGRLLLDDALPASNLGLFVSGRASFEMVAKAWAGGFPVVVAVSAPTALAVTTARRAGILLVGFVRDTGFNIYSPERPRTPPIA